MQTHVVERTKQRLSDFFVKEEGHVAHKNALVAGTVASGAALLASLVLTPDASACEYWCGDDNTGTWCTTNQETCCSGTDPAGDTFYFCRPIAQGCP